MKTPIVEKIQRLFRCLSEDLIPQVFLLLGTLYPAGAQALIRDYERRRRAGRNPRVRENVRESVRENVRDKTPEVSGKVSGKMSGTTPLSSDSYPPGFTSFWSSYPKRVGKAKALESWKRQKLEQKAYVVLAGLEQNMAYLLRESGKFTPNPATWLNQGRWEDEVSPPKSTAQRLWDEAQEEQTAIKTDATLDQNRAGS